MLTGSRIGEAAHGAAIVQCDLDLGGLFDSERLVDEIGKARPRPRPERLFGSDLPGDVVPFQLGLSQRDQRCAAAPRLKHFAEPRFARRNQLVKR